MPRRLAALIVTALATLTACGSPYVNIPSQPGDLATHSPDGRSVRDAVVPAVQAMLEREAAAGGRGGPVRIEMPEGAGGVTSATVARLAGEPAVGEGEVSEQEAVATLAVVGVRIRGTGAEVDIRHRVRGFSQLHTVYMKRTPVGGGWQIERVRAWRGGDPTLPVSPPAHTPTTAVQ